MTHNTEETSTEFTPSKVKVLGITKIANLSFRLERSGTEKSSDKLRGNLTLSEDTSASLGMTNKLAGN